jgi:hypothetical protein
MTASQLRKMSLLCAYSEVLAYFGGWTFILGGCMVLAV